jgi:hypothetical protein
MQAAVIKSWVQRVQCDVLKVGYMVPRIEPGILMLESWAFIIELLEW